MIIKQYPYIHSLLTQPTRYSEFSNITTIPRSNSNIPGATIDVWCIINICPLQYTLSVKKKYLMMPWENTARFYNFLLEQSKSRDICEWFLEILSKKPADVISDLHWRSRKTVIISIIVAVKVLFYWTQIW